MFYSHVLLSTLTLNDEGFLGKGDPPDKGANLPEPVPLLVNSVAVGDSGPLTPPCPLGPADDTLGEFCEVVGEAGLESVDSDL